jgi:hypothetical protein
MSERKCLIPYETEVRDGTKYELIESGIGYCCDRMKHAIEEIFDWASIDDEHYNVIPKFAISKSHGPYGESWEEDDTIDYCPFCGANIEYAEKKRTEFQQVTKTRTVMETDWIEKRRM